MKFFSHIGICYEGVSEVVNQKTAQLKEIKNLEAKYLGWNFKFYEKKTSMLKKNHVKAKFQKFKY